MCVSKCLMKAGRMERKDDSKGFGYRGLKMSVET